MKHKIGETLKKCRLDANKTVKEISNLLISKGFKASEKTIYSWEAGNSQPSPDALLIMCNAYGVTDVLGTFGYAEKLPIEKPTTIAAHLEGDGYSKEQIDRIEAFIRFVKTDAK